MHQFGVCALGPCGQLVEHLVCGPRGVAQPLHVEQGGLERGGDERLEVAVRDPRLGVLGRDHLALLGDPERPAHRARRLRQDGVIARAAATSDGSAATVEEPQPDSGLTRGVDQIQLGAVQRPVGRQVPAVLVGVRVAEHDLLAFAAGMDQVAIQRNGQQRGQAAITLGLK